MKDVFFFVMLAAFVSNFAIPDTKWRILEAFKKQSLMWIWACVFFFWQSTYIIIVKDTHCDNISE